LAVRINGVEVKFTSLVNVVKLLQIYTPKQGTISMRTN
jgi:hypothetical protein